MKSTMTKKGPDVNVPSAGYPQTDIDKAGIWVKGKYPAGTPNNKHMKARGTGAATKGLMFLNNTVSK
jgi:hypothetical protein